MNTVWFADPQNGSVVGYSWPDETERPSEVNGGPPESWVEVPAPNHGLDKWDFENNEYISYVPVKPLAERLEEMFLAQSAEIRAAFYPIKAGVKDALSLGDVEAARLIIAGAQISTELEPLRQQLLDQFPEDN